MDFSDFFVDFLFPFSSPFCAKRYWDPILPPLGFNSPKASGDFLPDDFSRRSSVSNLSLATYIFINQEPLKPAVCPFFFFFFPPQIRALLTWRVGVLYGIQNSIRRLPFGKVAVFHKRQVPPDFSVPHHLPISPLPPSCESQAFFAVMVSPPDYQVSEARAFPHFSLPSPLKDRRLLLVLWIQRRPPVQLPRSYLVWRCRHCFCLLPVVAFSLRFRYLLGVTSVAGAGIAFC